MNLSDSWIPSASIERKNAAEAVFHALSEAIEAKTMPLGTKLGSEASLAAHFSVSRSVIREALRSCAALGLTRTETGRGTFVISHHRVTEHDLGAFSSFDLYEARPHIEVPAARLAATRRSDADLERLNRAAKDLEIEQDSKRWVQLDAVFHEAVAQASGNSFFIRVVSDIREALAQKAETVEVVPERRDPSNHEHQLIMQAIAAGDGNAAAEAMRDHLTAVQLSVSAVQRSNP